jgi:hypothetical protein
MFTIARHLSLLIVGIILKLILEKSNVKIGLHWTGSRLCPMVEFYEHGAKSSGCITRRNFSTTPQERHCTLEL